MSKEAKLIAEVTVLTQMVRILSDKVAEMEALAQPEHGWTPERIAGMARLKEAQDKKLAQPEQEPVAIRLSNGVIDVLGSAIVPIGTLLYTIPPQRTWVGLTDDEIWQTVTDCTIGGD